MWRHSLETESGWHLFLQDDVLPAPYFWPALQAMLAAVPDQVIGLEAAHPAGQRLALEGHRWYTTADMLIGPGYVMPRAALGEFLRWRREELRPGAVEAINEDTLIGVWAWATGRRIWHPVPTIIDHDTEIESTYGNGAHKHRRPTVTWRDGDVLGFAAGALEGPDWWRKDGVSPPHLGCFYAATPHLARMWLRRPETIRGEDEPCPDEYRRYFA